MNQGHKDHRDMVFVIRKLSVQLMRNSVTSYIRVFWEHIRMVPGKTLEQKKNTVLMSKSYTSKVLHWKTLVLPCELMTQNEVIET